MGDFLLIDDPSCEGIPELSQENIFSHNQKALNVVVVGGGTGASSSIRALRALGICPDAVVAMADDGGSTGLLRSLDDVTPPGDIRKCLVALSQDPKNPFVKAFSGRLPDVSNHALGNLILAAFEDMYGSFPEAIEACEKLLDTCGHVYPSTLDHVHFVAKNSDGAIIFGQHDACVSQSALKNVGLLCDTGNPVAYEPALIALRDADLIVLGPGSLFTSVVPNLLVAGITEAIRESSACVVYVCSLFDVQGETRGFSVLDYFEYVERFGLRGRIDAVIAQTKSVFSKKEENTENLLGDLVVLSEDDNAILSAQGVSVFARDLCDQAPSRRHDVAKLSSVFAEVISTCHLPRK